MFIVYTERPNYATANRRDRSGQTVQQTVSAIRFMKIKVFPYSKPGAVEVREVVQSSKRLAKHHGLI